MLSKFSCFCCHLLIFFKINFFKEKAYFKENYQSQLNGLGPDQDRSVVQLFAEVLSRRLERKGWHVPKQHPTLGKEGVKISSLETRV